MTVPASTRRAGPFLGNGVATSFPFTFKTTDADEVQVVLLASGVETALVKDSDFSVTLNVDQDATPGGTITYPVTGDPLAAGESLTVAGAVPYSQDTDLPTGGNYSARVVEDALDRRTIQIQQLAEEVGRALTLPLSSAGVSTTLPPPEADALLGWNSEANALQNVDPTTLATIVAFGTANYLDTVGDGVAKDFTLPSNPGALANLDVSVDGVTQRPVADYTWVGGTTLSFVSAPPLGAAVFARYLQALPQGATDSAASAYVQAGTGAVQRNVRDVLREEVHTKDFGAVHDGVTDDTAAITAAITYAATLVKPKLVVDRGDAYCTGPLLFDLPNGSTIEFIGNIRSSTSNSPAVRLGSASVNRLHYTVTGLKVNRTTNDTTGGSSGVQIRNLCLSSIDIRQCTGFRDGVLCYGDRANGGVSYNEIYLGQLHDNRTNVHLTAAGVGYCNENNFYGGSFNHSSSYPAVTTVNLQIDHFVTSPLNNNRFFGPSFEDNTALATAASINGTNYIYKPRMENPAIQSTYAIQLEANSIYCEVDAHSFATQKTNIVDLGSSNSYRTKDYHIIRSTAGAAAGDAGLVIQTTATSAAKAVSVRDSGGTENAWVKGTGAAQFKNLNLSGLGTYANDAAAGSAGLVAGDVYKTAAGALLVKL